MACSHVSSGWAEELKTVGDREGCLEVPLGPGPSSNLPTSAFSKDLG
jgi:hypothetical protein